MLAVFNAVVGVLGAAACFVYGGLAIATYILAAPMKGADPLPYYLWVLVLGLTALLAAALAGGLLVGALTWQKHPRAQTLGLWLGTSATTLALLICLALALAPFPGEKDTLARLVIPAVAGAGVYTGLTLAVSLRDLLRPARR